MLLTIAGPAPCLKSQLTSLMARCMLLLRAAHQHLMINIKPGHCAGDDMIWLVYFLAAFVQHQLNVCLLEMHCHAYYGLQLCEWDLYLRLDFCLAPVIHTDCWTHQEKSSVSTWTHPPGDKWRSIWGKAKRQRKKGKTSKQHNLVNYQSISTLFSTFNRVVSCHFRWFSCLMTNPKCLISGGPSLQFSPGLISVMVTVCLHSDSYCTHSCSVRRTKRRSAKSSAKPDEWVSEDGSET